jgi:four helix bundle protein
MMDEGHNGAKKAIKDADEMSVWQSLFKLATEVERATRKYGVEFRWLRIQSLRSSESVCANVTEGFYSQCSTEYLQALYRSRREARETITHIIYAMEVRQLSPKIGSDLLAQYREALKQLANVIISIERKIRDRGKSKAAV